MPPKTLRDRAPSSRTSGIGTKSTDDRLDEIYEILRNLITEDVLDKKLEKLRLDIQLEHAERIEALEERVNTLETENDNLKVTISELENELLTSQDRQSEMAGKYNDLEQQGRKNSVRIVGLPDPGVRESVEDCVQTIVGFVRDTLKVPLQERDIDIAHRLGKYNGTNPRNVIVKFTHRRKKHEIIRARKILKGSKFVIYEDLTSLNQQRLKEAFRMNCVKNSYSTDGKIYVILTNGKKRRLLHDTPLEESYLMNDANFVSRR
ncbi:uncharacterized protein LOC132546780 [Ylistrum balloti]|uniref:uncharacterized protein LOC132546780 n=1 Tax=Ylistrum balloti TaxID=509963 RepID=UPI0029057EC3|nr:uncharacterized protein LOC132546780 [Ylistrum balloti]